MFALNDVLKYFAADFELRYEISIDLGRGDGAEWFELGYISSYSNFELGVKINMQWMGLGQGPEVLARVVVPFELWYFEL